ATQKRRELQMKLTTFQSFVDLSMTAAKVAALWIGGYLSLSDKLTPGQVIAITMYLALLLRPFSNLSSTLSLLSRFRASLRKIAEITTQKPEQAPAQVVAKHHLRLKGKIKLEQVSFRYNDESPWILRDINLTLYPKQVVAVVGPSGCGKSTLV